MLSSLSVVGRHGRRRLGAVFVCVIAVVAGAAPVAAALSSISFVVLIGSCGLGGSADPNTHLRIDVESHAGALKSRTHVTANGSGNWTTGCLPHLVIQARDQVSAYQGGSIKKLLVLPRFNVAIDRVNDRAKGNGPFNDDVLLSVQSCFPGGITCESTMHQTIHTSATGTFSTPLLDAGVTAWDAIGNQTVQLQWTSDDGDTLYLEDFVPYLQATAGSSFVSGGGTGGVSQTVTLRAPGGQPKATASATGKLLYGSWSSTLKKNGSAVKVKLGDTIHGSFAPDASLKVRPISAHVDLVANTLSGTCFPHQLAGVRLKAPHGTAQAVAWGTTGLNGELGTLNISGMQFVKNGWTLDLYCGTSHGDVLHRRQVVP